MTEALTLTDPTAETMGKPGVLWRPFLKLIRDERDLPFVKLALWLTLVFVPLAIYLFTPGNFNWWLVGVYWMAYAWYLGPYVLMLHNTSHRTLFKPDYALLNKYIPWVVGPFVGMSPDTYFVHHMQMHHVDDNLPDDLSSTMKWQRDNFFHFIQYYLAALFGWFSFSKYLLDRGKKRMLKRFWIGEAFYIIATIGLLYLNWRPALMLFAIPFVFTRFMLMAGNWGQHAFIDPDDPKNDYKTVITFINSPYNHRCFNDGYHLGHHLRASRHWLDMPADFHAKREEMIAARSLVFRKLDYFMIFVLLMTRSYKTLTKFTVQLDTDNPLSEEELIALFKQRVQRFDPETLESLSASRAKLAKAAA